MASTHDNRADVYEHDLGEHSSHADDPKVEDAQPEAQISPRLLDLDLPKSDLDLTGTFESILSEPQSRDDDSEVHTVQKRASNVLKLTQENEKLQAELRAMTARLEAAERRQQVLAARAVHPQGGNRSWNGSS